MSHIFISYSRKDVDFAQKIVDALATNNLDTWIDWKSIPKGEDWEQEIYRGIEEADAFLFLISPDSVASPMCNKEIAHAVQNHKRILPIVIRDANVHEFSAETANTEISKRNWIFCRDGQDDFGKAIEEIQQTIHTDYEWLRYHTELQVNALKWEQEKDASRLLRGRALREAEKQLSEVDNQEDPQPTKLQREYVHASRTREDRQRRRITIGLGLGLFITTVLSIFAWIQRNEAISQRAIAVSQRLAVNANSALETDDGSLSLLLAMEAVRATYSLDQTVTDEAEQSLRQAIAASPWRTTVTRNREGKISIYGSKEDFIEATGYNEFESLPSLVTNIEKQAANSTHSPGSQDAGLISPDGKFRALAGDDGTIRVWDAATGRQVAVLSNPDIYPGPGGHTLVFSAESRFLAAKGSGSGPRLWKTDSWQEIELGVHGWPTHKVRCPIDGDAVFYEQTVLTTGCDGVIRSYDVETGELKEIIGSSYQTGYEKLYLGNHWERVVAVPPDILLAATMPGGVMLWVKPFSDETETGWHEHMLLSGHSGNVTTVVILDENVITAGEDGTIRFWNASKKAAYTEANNPETSIEELMALAQQRVQRNPPELTCEERVEYLKESLDCLIATPTP